MKETNIVKVGCAIFIVYVIIILGALVSILLMQFEPSSWFEIKPKHPSARVQGNCDSLMRVKCDSLGIDYNTIGTTTDPD